MTALPTPEQFLASPPDPEEDLEDVEQPVEAPAPAPTAAVARTTPRDSLESIAESLGRVAAALTHKQVTATNEATEPLLQRIDELESEFREIEALHDAKQELIEQALVILKPSTSKLANNLRAVLEPVVTVAPEPEPVPGSGTVEQPAHDADVEEWRAYARSRGEDLGVDTLNRSQIRTRLGITQTEGGES